MKRPDPAARVVRLVGPGGQHRLAVRDPPADHRVQDVILGLEVMVEIAARDAQGLGDVSKGRGREPALIEERIGPFR